MAHVIQTAMDLVYENSVSAIEGIQARFHHQSNMLFMVSNIFDPRYAFLFYAPLFFSLDWNIGMKIMWVTVIGEWSAQVLKWLLHGERPYWWIHETQVYNKTGTTTPELQQFFLTCETGPGSPSGHSMITAAVWYVILASYLQKYNFIKKDSKNLFSKFCWLAYLVLLMTVGISRVFIAAHFPHQCFIGMALGCLVALILDNITRHRLNIFHYCLITLGLLSSAMGVFGFLKMIGVNPLWSVDRAVKWCAKPEYVHLDTSPFFSMMRYCGFMLGMGFGFNSKTFTKLTKSNLSTAMKITCAMLSVGVCKLFEKINLPKDNMLIFYIEYFFLNALLAYVIIAVVPAIVMKIGSPAKKKTH